MTHKCEGLITISCRNDQRYNECSEGKAVRFVLDADPNIKHTTCRLVSSRAPRDSGFEEYQPVFRKLQP